MLKYFRINDPYRLVSLLIILVLAGLPNLIDLPPITTQELKGMVLGETIGDRMMYVEVVDRTAPLAAVSEGVLDFVFGRSLLGRHIFALLIIFLQAAYFAILLINNKAYNESTYLPGLVFGLLCFFSFDILAATPELFASALLLLALNNIFKEIEFRIERDSIVMNLGVFLGLASLFVFSYIIFLPGTIFLLVAFARASARKILLLLFGFVLTHGVIFTMYYFFDHIPDLWSHYYVANWNQHRDVLVSGHSLLILGALPAFFFVASLFMMTREARFTRYQTQLFQVLFLWLLLAGVQVLLTPQLTPHSFITFIPSLAYLFSNYLVLIRRKRIAEVMLWILILGLIALGLLTRNGRIKDVSYDKLFPPPSVQSAFIENKRILIVGSDIDLYRRNRLAGYFFDWELSSKYFREPGNYEFVIKIHKSLEGDPPDLIVDLEGLMGPVLEKMPDIRSHYAKEGKVYRRI